MNVSDIMTPKPVTIRHDQSLWDAIEGMTRLGCHHLPVLSADGHIVGIITESDCRRALQIASIQPIELDDHVAARKMLVRQYMSPAPIIVEPSMPADEAARLMLTHHISCLPVMRSETLVGIVTTSDVLMAFIQLQKTSETSPLVK